MIVLKDTPLVSLAGLNDLVANAKIAAGATKQPFLFFIVAALFFIAFSAITLRLSARARAPLCPGHRGGKSMSGCRSTSHLAWTACPRWRAAC